MDGAGVNTGHRTTPLSPEVQDVLVRLDDRAKRLAECLTAQLEQDYPLTYERAYWLVCGITDYLPTIKAALEARECPCNAASWAMGCRECCKPGDPNA